jgi:hypothetical protein
MALSELNKTNTKTRKFGNTSKNPCVQSLKPKPKRNFRKRPKRAVTNHRARLRANKGKQGEEFVKFREMATEKVESGTIDSNTARSVVRCSEKNISNRVILKLHPLPLSS